MSAAAAAHAKSRLSKVEKQYVEATGGVVRAVRAVREEVPISRQQIASSTGAIEDIRVRTSTSMPWPVVADGGV